MDDPNPLEAVEARREAEDQGFPRRSHYAQGHRRQTMYYYRGGQSSVTGDVIIRVAWSYIWVHSATCASAYAHGNITFRMFAEVSLNAEFHSVVIKTQLFVLVTVTTSFI